MKQAIALKGVFKNNRLIKVLLLSLENLQTIELTREKYPSLLNQIEEALKRKKPDEVILITKTDKVKVTLSDDPELRKLKENRGTNIPTRFVNTEEVV